MITPVFGFLHSKQAGPRGKKSVILLSPIIRQFLVYLFTLTAKTAHPMEAFCSAVRTSYYN